MATFKTIGRWIFSLWPEYILVGISAVLGPYSGMGTKELITLTILLICQNAAFTIVSRARQSKSLTLHGLAAIGSNGLYIFVLTTVVANYNNNWLKIWYIICTVIGSVHAHYISIHKVEESKRFKKDSLVSHTDLKIALEQLEAKLAEKYSESKMDRDSESPRVVGKPVIA